MSVPPLVSSSPPPPDHCDDDLEDEDFTYGCAETSFSPPKHFETDKYGFDNSVTEKVPTNNVENTDSSFYNNENEEKIEACKNQDENPHDNIEKRDDNRYSEEENNIEDLDLELNSLQIDFQNCKESVEDSLNASFDDFGTFFNSSTLNDSPDTSYYFSELTEKPAEIYEKDFIPRSTPPESSDPSQIEEKHDVHDELHISRDASFEILKTTSEIESETETSPSKESTENVEKCADSDLHGEVCDTDLRDSSIIDKGSKTDLRHDDDDVAIEFAVDWSNNFDDETRLRVEIISQDKPNDEKLSSTEKCFTFEGDFDDFEDFATFKSGEINDILNASQHRSSFDFDEDANSTECDVNAAEEIKLDGDQNCTTSLSNVKESGDDDDDDFGDFDTYNPSDQCKTITNESDKNEFIIDDFSIENETVNNEKLITTVNNVFLEEDTLENDEELKDFDLELTLSLGESWKHLKNYEAEQLYLFPWNNSASQKSLLKSLGIDSRNILFGPKWNMNMPRFAANLGSNPLQPIKRNISQFSSDPISDRKPANTNEVQPTVTSSGKELEWENGTIMPNVDFQASSYAESLLLDLEHLMATLDQMTSGQSVHFKISDLFSNACNERGDEQLNTIHTFESHIIGSETNKIERPPLPTVLNIGRKINLPDTHIFTPTDSETPWSHTIHYNDENCDNFPCNANTLSKLEKNIVNPNDNFDEFDDFQCHKTNDNIKTDEDIKTNTIDSTQNTNSLDAVSVENNNTVFKIPPIKDEVDDFGDFQSANTESSKASHFPVINLLEPVKIIPTTPIVNWPEPGEVKSLNFDDFSFINPSNNLSVNNEIENHPDTSQFSNDTGPTQFILKESKIDGEVDFINNQQLTEPSTSISKISHDQNDLSDFSNLNLNFGSTSNQQVKDSQIKIVSNVESIGNVSTFDDFNDFQSAKFVPLGDSQNKRTGSPLFSTTISDNDSISKKNPMGNFTLDLYDKSPMKPICVRSQTEDHIIKNTSQQILQPLSLENYSQINWPNPGIDLQDLTRFNPLNSIKSYSEPKESPRNMNEQSNDDDGWSDFVSSKPSASQFSSRPMMPNVISCNGLGNQNTTGSNMDDSDDWSDFVSSALPSKSTGELKTISQNIHSQTTTSNPSYVYSKNQNATTAKTKLGNQNMSNALPNLRYISPKSNIRSYNSHLQDL